MATIKLVPSHYDRSNSSYVTVTNPTNMYYDTDHTANYCTIRGRAGRSSNSTYYAFINGFDFSQVPAGATVNSFTVRIRCYRNQYENTGSSYRMRFCSAASNNNVISGTTASTDIGTSVSVITIPTGSITWNDLINYSNFSIEIRLRNTSTSSSNYPYVYVYGAEIEVDYTPLAPGSPDIYSNYYKRIVAGGWNPCVEGNNQYGLLPYSGCVLPNCSGFATGRFNELLNLNACTYLGNANGGDFMYFAALQSLPTGSEPVVGGAMVWKNSGEGHVAIVDQIIDSNTIVTVESGWYYTSTPIVRYVTRTRGNGSWHTNPDYNYQGCIYPPGVPGEEDDDEYYYIMFMQRLKNGY